MAATEPVEEAAPVEPLATVAATEDPLVEKPVEPLATVAATEPVEEAALVEPLATVAATEPVEDDEEAVARTVAATEPEDDVLSTVAPTSPVEEFPCPLEFPLEFPLELPFAFPFAANGVIRAFDLLILPPLITIGSAVLYLLGSMLSCAQVGLAMREIVVATNAFLNATFMYPPISWLVCLLCVNEMIIRANILWIYKLIVISVI